MILHTIIDIAEVMEPSFLPKISDHQYKIVDNCIVKGVQCKSGFRVLDIFSTDPNDYLNPKFQKDTMIK